MPDILRVIERQGRISASKLENMFPGQEDSLLDDLNRLLSEGKIYKRLVYLCPNCGTTLGKYSPKIAGSNIECEFCDTEFAIDKRDVEFFFFPKREKMVGS